MEKGESEVIFTEKEIVGGGGKSNTLEINDELYAKKLHAERVLLPVNYIRRVVNFRSPGRKIETVDGKKPFYIC